MIDPSDMEAGAHNLLVNCAQIQEGETVLIVHEDPQLGWYDEPVLSAIEEGVRKLFIEPEIMRVGPPGGGDGERAKRATADFDCTIFLARIGDQDRFDDPLPGHRTVMVYARNGAMLGSDFGKADHRAMLEFKQAINRVTASAKQIEITCGLGTNFVGSPEYQELDAPQDVSVQRFPMAVPAPVEAKGFSGRVALARYLTPTGSQVYDPPHLQIEGVVFAEVENGRIAGFSGDRQEVEKIEQHYASVSTQLGIEPDYVHSWHAGIHPACAYDSDPADNPDRWSNFIFPNPRILHFHTCGNYAPGEICWMVLDPTIAVDGEVLWKNGRLMTDQFSETKAVLDTWPELKNLFGQPELRIGV
ncbi:MAG: hypothetical protein AAF478_07910 [Pseudomonadota bacterium]